MKNDKIVVLLFCMAVFSAIADANSLYLEKSSYNPGETATAIVTVENINTYPVIWKVECSFVSNNSDYPPTSFIDDIRLNPDEIRKLEYSLGITNTTPSGTFTLRAVLKDMSMFPIWENETHFSVSGTLQSMNLSLRICKVSGCQQSEALFFTNEIVYIEYDSSVSNTAVIADIKNPDNNIIRVSLPYSMPMSQTGSYNVHAMASKNGYSDAERYADFAAIAGQTNISESDFIPFSTTTTAVSVAETTTTISSTSTIAMSTTLLTTTTSQTCSGACGSHLIDCLCGSDCIEKGNCCPDSCSECGTCEGRAPDFTGNNTFLIVVILIMGLAAAIIIMKFVKERGNPPKLP